MGLPDETNHEWIELVLASDENFVMPLAVTLFSVVKNLKPSRKLRITILDGGIGESSQVKLVQLIQSVKKTVEIHFKKVDYSNIKDLFTTKWLNFSTYYRLFIPEVLPETVTKAIYLDCDIIVNRCIGELWDVELGDQVLGAVDLMGVGMVSDSSGLPEIYQELGLEPKTPMFNAGILLINLRQWREENISVRVFEFTRRFSAYLRYADQDGLNAVLAGNWKRLDPRWNVQLGAIYNYGAWPESAHKVTYRAWASTSVTDAFIWHFVSHRKPWNAMMTNPSRQHFDRYLWESRWYSGEELLGFCLRRGGHWGKLFFSDIVPFLLKKLRFSQGLHYQDAVKIG